MLLLNAILLRLLRSLGKQEPPYENPGLKYAGEILNFTIRNFREGREGSNLKCIFWLPTLPTIGNDTYREDFD